MFKEHLAVATLSDRCFRIVLSICDKYSKRELKYQNSTKVNVGLFRKLPGKVYCSIFRLLTGWLVGCFED